MSAFKYGPWFVYYFFSLLHCPKFPFSWLTYTRPLNKAGRYPGLQHFVPFSRWGKRSERMKDWTLLHCWWECKLVQSLWRTVWSFLKKLEIELPYDPAIPLLGIHTEETRSERDMCTPMFIAALFIIARTWKQPRCPSADEWIRKLWYIYTQWNITQPLKIIHLNQF